MSGGGFDFPFEEYPEPEYGPAEDYQLAGGLTVAASYVPVTPELRAQDATLPAAIPALVFRFLDASLNQFPVPILFVVKASQMLSIGTTLRRATRAAVEAAGKVA